MDRDRLDHVIERLENAPASEAAGYIGEVVQELRRIRAASNPMAWTHRWIGDCGHEWRKDQAANCPICENVDLRVELAKYGRGATPKLV